jgi:hypothetical protein
MKSKAKPEKITPLNVSRATEAADTRRPGFRRFSP